MAQTAKRALGRPKVDKKATGEILKGFGERLRSLREKRGLTQQSLAKAIGTEWTQISRYEREVNFPTADRVVTLAQALRTTPNKLLLGTRNQDEKLEFKNLVLYERFLALDKLPRDEQETVLRILEAVLAKNELAHLVERVRRTA